jgi:hypothetical protein
MKKITFIISFLILNITLYAQNNQGKTDDIGRISLSSVVPEQIEGLTPAAQSSLRNKLNQIASKNGMGGSSLNNRFIITANVSVLTKDITATAPPMNAYTLDVTLYIGDGIEGTLFSSISVSLKGVGETETKAYLAALKNLKVDDPKYQSFIEKGKNKIIEFYNSKCDFILKEAEMLSSRNEFDEAILKLINIPDVCKDCYNKAMEAVKPIYQKKIDRECKIKLEEAKGIWSAGQDIASAEKACAILVNIDPSASCFAEVQDLNKKIAEKVKQIDDREWKYTLKNQAQESERIQAIKAIGVAYGNNQPQNVTYKYSGWW